MKLINTHLNTSKNIICYIPETQIWNYVQEHVHCTIEDPVYDILWCELADILQLQFVNQTEEQVKSQIHETFNA